jgi:hypothetical protein
MHKDVHVAEIEMTAGVLHIVKILNKAHMPWGVRNVPLDLIDKRLEKWLNDRCIPKAQPNYKTLMSKAGVSSVTEMPTKSYMCSLTDCYWFKPIKDQVCWKDVNFYDNGFDETAGKITLNGDDTVTIENWNIPELTTNGVLPKRWFQGKNGEFYLLKAGTPPDHKEVYNEAFAAQVASLFEMDVVPYAIYHDNNTNQDYSVCPSFIHNDNEEFVTLEQIRISLGGSHQMALDWLYENGFGEAVDLMRGFDYLIKNRDRHFGNIGVIIDPNTMQIKRLAPLFDHGFSMDVTLNQSIEYMQKLTGNTDAEELVVLDHLQWTLADDIKPIDLMRRARETYRPLYDNASLMQLVGEIGTRLLNLQTRAEQLEKLERDIEGVL